MFACISCFFPLFSPVDPETAADAPVIDYVDDDPPSCLSNQASPPPPWLSRYRPIYTLILALDFATILMHSLLLYLLLLPTW